ncbi:hypothetical protein SAMN04489812_4045 [Microlunatus soli]|uniref:Alkaline shock response membrane anchor protein AmaP n=2 Tax=Microlunatus soli TaxID=630515 RepID=A0A1H1XFH6_9ACTN|nr:hypothetical protein SAMN04489812_4045 [Microlunatus soli]
MRRRSTGSTNRFWLVVVGLLLVLAGAIAICLGLGLGDRIARAAGITVSPPGPGSTVFGSGRLRSMFTEPVPTVLIGVGGLLVAAMALGWLIFQLPRRDPAPLFGLHDDARRGLINCDSKVIAAALADRVEQLPGIQGADIAVRGTARHPQVTAELRIDDRATPAEVTRQAVERISADLSSSLDAELDRVAVRVTVGGSPTSSGHAVLAGSDG